MCCRYYFPTFEDDNLLCALDDDASDDVTALTAGVSSSHDVTTAAHVSSSLDVTSPERFAACGDGTTCGMSSPADDASGAAAVVRAFSARMSSVVIAEDCPVTESMLATDRECLQQLQHS